MILEFVEPEIYMADPDDWETADKAYQIASDSNINIFRSKELTLVAQIGDEVVGAVWSSFTIDDDYSKEAGEDVYCYDFDVVVSSKSRSIGLSSARIGPKLIDEALKHYRSLRSEFGNAYIRVWVVNPKLAGYLERRYGFQPEGGGNWSRSDPYMVYHGK